MSQDISNYQIYVVRAPGEDDRRISSFATVFRKLRIDSLESDPESFRETVSEVSARPQSYWKDFVKSTNGLTHIAFGVPLKESHNIDNLDENKREAWLVQNAVPLAMAVNTGPIPSERFPRPQGKDSPENRPDSEELRFHGGMLYMVPWARGPKRASLTEALTLDRNIWLLDLLQLTAARNQLQSPGGNRSQSPVGRLRGVIKPGKNANALFKFYTTNGWYIAGKQTVRDNVLAEGGEDAVRAAEAKGYNVDEVYTAVEKIFTMPQLEQLIVKNRKNLAALSKKTGGKTVKL